MKKYFSYFKILYIVLVVLALVVEVMAISRLGFRTRSNHAAPSQRVYDYAGVLSAGEEADLEELIAKSEKKIGGDIVLVIIDESVLDMYGYTDTDANWELAMQTYADDFYDENDFGFDKVHGDGVLLLDNWYEGETGSYLSTCGRIYTHYDYYMIQDVIDAVNEYVEHNPYKAYQAYIETVTKEMAGGESEVSVFPLFCVSVLATVVFMSMHLKNKEGEKTTVASTYVVEGSIRFNEQREELVKKYVTSRVIQTSSGSGGGRSGGSGGHRSSGGVSHGGGGGRR